MLDPVVLIGEPLDFKNQIKIYPPTIKQVITNLNFGMYYRLLTITEEDLMDELKTDEPPTPLEFLLANCYNSPEFEELAKQAFDFFCHTTITLLYSKKQILIGTIEDYKNGVLSGPPKVIKEDEYFDFQNKIRQACGDKMVKPPEAIDPNEDPRIRSIKEKARKRDRIKAKQAGKNGISLSTCLTAICCMGIGLTPLNIGEMSYASVGEIMKMMQDKEKYDIDIRSLLAGADSKKIKPKYWIRNSDKE